MIRFPACLAFAVALVALAPQAGAAAELVVGGYGAGVAADPTPGGPGVGGLPGMPEDGGSLVLDFTPRGGAGLLSAEQGDDSPRLHFELNVTGSPVDWPDTLAVGSPAKPSWLTDPNSVALGELSIGGALRWSEWSLGGGYARTALFGGEAQLMSATVGYGPLIASLAYGQTERPDFRPMDVLMLSTDVTAWSWLTVESNLALGSDGAADSVAVGRLGVRLNF